MMPYANLITRQDDPDGVMAHAGKYAGGVALIVLGGPSGADWQALKKRIQPDVVLTANGSTQIPGADYWMLAENMHHQHLQALQGDSRGVAFMQMLNSPNTATWRLVSHRSWDLLDNRENAIRIRRMGWELDKIPEAFSLREYGEGYLNGWMFRHREAAQPRVEFRVGTVGLQLLHHAGILGVREVHTIGYDLMIKGGKHHWYNYPRYKADRFTTDEMFVRRQYGRVEVNTRWAWVETAEYLREIKYLFDRAGLDWIDHSDGLLKYEGVWCAQTRPAQPKAPAAPVQNSVIEYKPDAKTFVAWDHQGKGAAYIEALRQARHRYSGDIHDYRKMDFVLSDHAILGRGEQIAMFWKCGTRKIFIYPHTARPNLVNDIEDEFPAVTAHFVAAAGHVDVMRAYGYEKPIEVAGWSLCPIRPFQARQEARRVLFAPIHPRCDFIDQQLNREVWQKLLKLARADDIALTVRYIGDIREGGLEIVDHPNVSYTPGNLVPSWEQIDAADVVISHQTFAWLAVARGVPTVMMGEDMPAHLVPRGQPPKFANNWRRYADLLAFPLDIIETRHPLQILGEAIKHHPDVEGWKARMIGEPFDAARFVTTLESYF